MATPEQAFFTAALTAGAILTGFCGTFLSFRIQREANYHRQPALDFKMGKARDVFIGLSHFSSGFFALIIASLTTMLFGLVLPVLKLSGLAGKFLTVRLVAAGLLSSLVLICGYFFVELIHYNILSNRLLHDSSEWGRQSKWIIAWMFMAGVVFIIVGYLL